MPEIQDKEDLCLIVHGHPAPGILSLEHSTDVKWLSGNFDGCGGQKAQQQKRTASIKRQKWHQKTSMSSTMRSLTVNSASISLQVLHHQPLDLKDSRGVPSRTSASYQYMHHC